MTRKMLAISLLITLAAAGLASPALSLAPRSEPTNGCPEHSSPTPSPQPAGHKCCQTGHQTAILQEPPKLGHSVATVLDVTDDPELLPPHSVESLLSPPFTSSSPPPLSSLRI